MDENEWFSKDSKELVKNGLFWYNLPYLVEGDFLMSESKAIEEYIIKRSSISGELLGKNPKEEAQIKMLCGVT